MRSLFLIFIFIPLLGNAQQIRQSAFIAAPAYSLFNSSSSEVLPTPKKGSLGAGAGYSIEYYLPKTISFGSSIEYYFTRGNFYTPCYCVHTLDKTVRIRNNISTHSFDIPLYLAARTNRDENRSLFFKTGIGTSILVNAHRVVESEVDFLNGAPVERVEIKRGNFQLRNDNNNILGSFYLISVGHSFNIKNLHLFSEFLFRQDLNFWNYHTVESPDGIKQVPFKRQSFILKTGLLF